MSGLGWHLEFKKLDFVRFVNVNTLAANREELCVEVLRQNPGFAATAQVLMDLICSVDDPGISPLFICAGHDICSVLAVWITAGTHVNVTRAAIEGQLRLALDLGFFIRAKFVEGVRRWETENSPFRLFRDFFPAKPAAG